MKTYATTIFLTVLFCLSATAQVKFDDYFSNKTICLDYYIFGDSAYCFARFEGLRTYKGWTGRRYNLDSCPSTSDMKIVITDNATGRTIYQDSYSTLRCEWQLTNNLAWGGIYQESVRIPFPTHPSTITLVRTYKSGRHETCLHISFNPKRYKFARRKYPKKKYPVENLLHASKSDGKSIDIVFLPEGYKEDEMDKFLAAARKMAEGLFEYEPYAQYKDFFNIKAVLAPSPDSGIDIPSEGIERKTLMDFTYDTFDSERYIGTRNHWAISELASNTTWSHAIVLVNDEKYGGGGIYNFYSVFPGGNPYILELFIHEFGHAFANLPDEYAEPDNPIGQKEESDRECIMKALDMRFFCDECKEQIEKVIRRNIGW